MSETAKQRREKWTYLFAAIATEFARDGCKHVTDAEIAAFGTLIRYAKTDIEKRERAELTAPEYSI